MHTKVIKVVAVFIVVTILLGTSLIAYKRMTWFSQEPVLYAIGTYSTINDEAIQIDVNTSKPVILAVTAHDSVRWNIKPSYFSNIQSIHVGGINEQKIQVISPCGKTAKLSNSILCKLKVFVNLILTGAGEVKEIVHHVPEKNPKKKTECFLLDETPITVSDDVSNLSEHSPESLGATQVACDPLLEKNFFAYDPGEEIPERRGFALRDTENGLELIEDKKELAKLDDQWLKNSGKREQMQNIKRYSELRDTLSKITNLTVSHFGGAEHIISAVVHDDGISINKSSKSTREDMLEYIKEYNEKYQQRKKDLLTPYKEEDKPSEFSYDTEKLIDYSDGYKFTFGKYGYVYDFDAFIYIPSMDLNDKEIGKSAEFSKDVLPDFLSLDLSKKLSEDKENLTLLYTLKNEGLNSMDDMQFIFFIDPETVFGDIEETKNSNNRTDEYGEMLGELGNGFVDSDPDYWEIDEPGYVFGNIIDNAKLGMLDNQNNVSEELHDDPSYAIGFDIKPFSSGQKIEVEILLSTKNDVVGSLQLVHKDKRLSDVLSISGQVELLEASIEE